MFKEVIFPDQKIDFDKIQSNGNGYFDMYEEINSEEGFIKYLDYGNRLCFKPWGVQGIIDLTEFNICNLRYKDKEVGPRIGFAFLESQENRVSQNYHSHLLTPEVIGVYLYKGDAYFYSNRVKFYFKQGPNTVIIPKGVPHDIVLEPNSKLFTYDVKNFIGNHRKDNLSMDFHLPGLENSKLEGENVLIEFFPHGMPVVYNPNNLSTHSLSNLGYNTGVLISCDLERLQSLSQIDKNNSDSQNLSKQVFFIEEVSLNKASLSVKNRIPLFLFATFRVDY
jgi:hypothetical protein